MINNNNNPHQIRKRPASDPIANFQVLKQIKPALSVENERMKIASRDNTNSNPFPLADNQSLYQITPNTNTIAINQSLGISTNVSRKLDFQNDDKRFNYQNLVAKKENKIGKIDQKPSESIIFPQEKLDKNSTFNLSSNNHNKLGYENGYKNRNSNLIGGDSNKNFMKIVNEFDPDSSQIFGFSPPMPTINEGEPGAEDNINNDDDKFLFLVDQLLSGGNLDDLMANSTDGMNESYSFENNFSHGLVQNQQAITNNSNISSSLASVIDTSKNDTRNALLEDLSSNVAKQKGILKPKNLRAGINLAQNIPNKNECSINSSVNSGNAQSKESNNYHPKATINSRKISINKELDFNNMESDEIISAQPTFKHSNQQIIPEIKNIPEKKESLFQEKGKIPENLSPSLTFQVDNGTLMQSNLSIKDEKITVNHEFSNKSEQLIEKRKIARENGEVKTPLPPRNSQQQRKFQSNRNLSDHLIHNYCDNIDPSMNAKDAVSEDGVHLMLNNCIENFKPNSLEIIEKVGNDSNENEKHLVEMLVEKTKNSSNFKNFKCIIHNIIRSR